MRRMIPRLLPMLVALVAVTLVGAPVLAADIDHQDVAELEATMVDLVNDERRARGLHELDVAVQQVRKAREHNPLMRDAGHLFHAQLREEIFPSGAWARIGENVAVASTVQRTHDALMDSDGHRANILHEDYTHIGIGILVDGDRLWTTQRFVALRPGEQLPLFADVDPSSPFADEIEALWRAGITDGCGNDRFCPTRAVSRQAMAAFIQRTLDLDGAPSPAGFPDVTSDHPFHDEIDALAAAGISQGYDDGTFKPGATVSRQAMAAFLNRAR